MDDMHGSHARCRFQLSFLGARLSAGDVCIKADTDIDPPSPLFTATFTHAVGQRARVRAFLRRV